jgi:selenocysteine-specific elongation factor
MELEDGLGSELESLIPVHVGLFGHVDHGKTELARALSEKVSTAGLDRHPESKRRQMTIDIGFTAFTLDKYLVTLVDVPGHADLIRTAVSGASIIDAAILVVSAKQGPQIQTGEHLIMLESLEVERVVVALTNTDLVDEAKLKAAKDLVKKVLSDSIYRDAPIVAVSSITGAGIPELKRILLSKLYPPKREVNGAFKMAIDHAFPIKGAGTIITGTVIRGRVKVNDEIEISPINLRFRVKSIQTFKESREAAEAGDRVGIALQSADFHSIYRGCYASSPGSLKQSNHIIAKAKVNRYFRHNIAPGLTMHITIGMSSVQAKVFPYRTEEREKVIATAQENEDFTSYIKLSRPMVTEKNDRILFSLLSLPPTSLRIAAGGIVIDSPSTAPTLEVVQERVGTVNRVIQGSKVLIEGLAKSRIGAQRLVGKTITKEGNVRGTLSSSFGGKGLIVAAFDQLPRKGETVTLRVYREFKTN